MFVLTLFYFFLSENCGREAREEESGALKETRRKGEGGKDEEEVSADVKIPMHLQQCVFYCLTLGFYFIGQDQGAESTEGKEAPSSVCQFIRSSLL